MLEFIIKYWLQFALGIVAGTLTWFGKRYWSFRTVKLEADRKKRYADLENKIVECVEKKIQKLNVESHEADTHMEEKLNTLFTDVEYLTKGMLSLQGKEFRNECRELLKPEHTITLDEYEQFEADYEAYKALKGNHKGDSLHAAVVEKFNAQVIK